MSSNTFPTAHASGESWQDAANQCLDALTKKPLPPGGLGLLYISDTIANEMAQVLELFRDRTGLSNWMGSVGIGICATGREYFDEPAVAAMVADIAPSGYRLFDGVDENLDNFNAEHSDWINTTGSHVAIVHADPRNPDAAGLIEDLADRLDGFLVGGFVSSRSAMPQIAGEPVEGGLSGALLADSVPVISGLTQSCLL
ncbi:MAG: FIST N-terminal domain-containing protein, partial [Rhodospirillales bacterium]